MKKLVAIFSVTLAVTGSFLFTSCSSSPSEEEMAQLQQLKDQVRSLESKVADSQREKSNLEKQIAEKNGKVQQCQSDQEAVKKALGGK